MNSFDFTFVVLPLGIIVFILVAGILLIVKKEEIEKDKKIRRINTVLKEKAKKRELAEQQLQELNSMLDTKSINKETYKRLKAIVEMHEESEAETGVILEKIWEE